MSNGGLRRRSIFSGVLLILLGLLFLLHNLRGQFDLWRLFERWWPLLLILWGLAKLYDHLAARRTGQTAPSTITGGEIFLVIALIAVVGTVVLIDRFGRGSLSGDIPWPPWVQSYSFSEELPTKPIPPGSRVAIRTDRGNITVHPAEAPEIRVLVKRVLAAGSESEAQNRARQTRVTISQTGDGYEVGTENQGGQTQVDLEVHVPKQASVTARTSRGGFQASGLAGNVTAQARRGDIEVRDTGGDVTAQLERGDARIVGAKGSVKLSGRGGQVEVSDVKGEAVVEGEFFGPIRVEKVAKGARFVSRRTDLSVSELSGRMEAGSGKLEISDAPGNVFLVTRKYDVVLENVGGRVHIENRDGDVQLRFSQLPREPVEVSSESGGIELVLPSTSSFDVRAETRSGEIACDFPDLASKVTEEHGTSKLEGKLGAKGPQLRLKTSYGTIRLRKGQSPPLAPPPDSRHLGPAKPNISADFLTPPRRGISWTDSSLGLPRRAPSPELQE